MEASKEIRKTYVQPNRSEYSYVLNAMEDIYAPLRVSEGEDHFTYAHFMRVLRMLDKTSSPGYPWMLDGSTIALYLGGTYEWEWWPERVEKLWWWVRSSIECGFNEEITFFRVFTKQEAHKRSKVESGRWRLIFAAPLHFQVVGQMLYSDLNDLECSMWGELPSVHGFYPVHGNWKWKKRKWDSEGYNTSMDKSGWDINAPGWVFEVSSDLRERLQEGASETWLRLHRQMSAIAYSRSRLVFGDGSAFIQTTDGIMKSGLVNTISDNSRAQVALHILACKRAGRDYEPLPEACGDDTLSPDFDDDYLEKVQQGGCLVKECSMQVDQKFVGTIFRHTGPVPEKVEKHLATYQFMREEVVAEALDSYCHIYAHSEYLSLWRRLLMRRDVSRLRSVAYYRSVYDEPPE